MDFFKELLQSFSKVHDRPLSLLEGKNDPPDPSRIAAASEKIRNSGIGKTSNALTIPGFVRGQPQNINLKYTPETGNLSVHNRGLVKWQPGAQISPSDPQQFKRAITFLLGPEPEREKEEKEETEDERLDREYKETVGEGAIPGEAVSEGNFQTEEARQDAAGAFQRMARFLKSAMTNIGLGSPEKFKLIKSSFFGKRIESLEKRIAESNKFLVFNQEFNGFVFEDGELIDGQIVGISETLENMMKSLATSSCPEGEQSFTKNIAKTSRGELVFSPHADASINEALVFTDDKGTLKNVIEEAFKGCGFEEGIPEISILSQETGGNSDNNTLGTGFEMFQKLASITFQASRLKAEGKKIPSEVISELAYVADKLQKKMKGLSAAARTAFIVQQTAGLSPEDSALVNDLKDLLTDTDDDGISLYKKMLEFSFTILKDRNPTYITEAGQETKFGKRQDIREYYKTADEARKALEKSGLNPNNYSMMTLQQLIDSGAMTERDAKVAIALGLTPNKNSEVAVAITSMKAYKSLKRVTWGKGSENTYLEMMDEEFDEGPHAQLIKTMLDDMGVPDAKKKEAWDEMREYHKKLSEVHDTLNDIPLTSDVLLSTGKGIKVNSGDLLADQINDYLIKNSTYDELTTGDKKEINKIVNRLRKEPQYKNYTAEALFGRLKKEVATLVTHRQLEKDLKNADTKQAALRSLLSKTYHAGGSDDSKLNETAFGWAEARTHVLSRNEVLRDIARGRKGWGVDFENSQFSKGIVKFSSGDADVTINTTAKATRNKTGPRSFINNETTLTVGEATNDMYDTRESKSLNASTAILKSLSKLHEALAVIEKKVSGVYF
tara:strand:+ start:3040 stop:5556 length:2517 start_codon:yes stop_codon:yes gene_type:complete